MMHFVRQRLFFFLILVASLISPFLFLTVESETNSAKPCAGGLSNGVFPCNHVTLQAQIPLARFSSKPASGSNLWGYVDLDDHREYAIIGLSNGTAVVDVTRPTAPRVVGIVPALRSL